MNRFTFSFLLLAGCTTILTSCTHSDSHHIALASNRSVAHEVPHVTAVPALDKKLSRQTTLAGELLPYEDVELFPKVDGFVDDIKVDRGSQVRKGQVLVRLNAPEIDAQVAEAKAKIAKARSAVQAAQSRMDNAKASVQEAQSRAEGSDITYHRLQKAMKVPGVIADNELDQAEKTASADREHVLALQGAVQAAASEVEAARSELSAAEETFHAIADIQQYLTVRAPFDGLITARNVHPGSLVKPNSEQPMLRCQLIRRLRLVVPVPEVAVGGLHLGEQARFTVPAHPGRTFVGTVSRLGHSLDTRTRTMPVELDVENGDGLLEAGMYPTVFWDVQRQYDTVFVPQTAVGHSLKQTYVDVVSNGRIHVVPVRTGQTMGDLIEVFGSVEPGQHVAVHASEDLPEGGEVVSQSAPLHSLSSAAHL